MDINSTFLQAAILFFPGVIVVAVLQLFRNKKYPYSNIEIIFYSFVLGMVVNIIIYGIILHKEIPINILLQKDNQTIPFKIEVKEFLLSFFVSIYLGVIFSYFRNLGSLHDIMRKLDVTYETGFPNILQGLLCTNDEQLRRYKGMEVEIKSLNSNLILEEAKGFIIQLDKQEDYFEIFLFNQEKNKTQYLQLKKGEFQINFIEPTEEEEDIEDTSVIDEKKLVLKSLVFFILYLLYCSFGIHFTLIEVLVFFISFKVFHVITILLDYLFKNKSSNK